jgi:hypothetical protein
MISVIVATEGDLSLTATKKLLQLLIPDLYRLTILQYVHDSGPLSRRRISPSMIGASLDATVSPLQQLLLPAVEDELNGAFQNDSVIETACPMHHALEARSKVDISEHRPSRVDDAHATL